MKDGTYRHYLWQEAGLSAGFLSDIEHRRRTSRGCSRASWTA